MRTSEIALCGLSCTVVPAALLYAIAFAMTACGSISTPGERADGGTADGGGDAATTDGGEIRGPRDLFDMDALKHLPLRDDDPATDDLCWTSQGEQTDPATGVTETLGTWCGGEFNTFEADDFDGHPETRGLPATIDLAEFAAIYWPPGYPDTDAARAGLGHVYAAHEVPLTRSQEGAALALATGMPVLQHGDANHYMGLLGIQGRGGMTAASGPNMMRVNPCQVVDLTRGNFGWALARTDIRAITLLQRLAEVRGGNVARVALMGGSKEGAATWLASAVDDRIEVDASGGYQREDPRTAFPTYAADWGCTAPDLADEVDVPGFVLFDDWMMRTPAGQAAERAFSVALFQTDLYPRFILIGGDTTHWDMHDGRHYPLGSETPFLDEFIAVSSRYDRTPNEAPEQGNSHEQKELRRRANILEQLIKGPGQLDSVYPKVTSAVAEDMGRTFVVRATVSPTPASTMPAVVTLWWSCSDSRVWNDQGNAAWFAVPMSVDAAEWSSPRVDVANQKGCDKDGGYDEVAWYVQAETTLLMGGQSYARRDDSPVRFLWRTPPIGCTPPLPDWCAP